MRSAQNLAPYVDVAGASPYPYLLNANNRGIQINRDELMNTADIDLLETKLDQLMLTVEQLRSDNAALRHKLAVSIRERTQLAEINERAAQKVKRTVAQLKEALS